MKSINTMKALLEAALLFENEDVTDVKSEDLPEDTDTKEVTPEPEDNNTDNDEDEETDPEEEAEEEKIVEEAFRGKKEHVLFENFINSTTYVNLFEALDNEVKGEETEDVDQPQDVEEEEVGLDESYYLTEADNKDATETGEPTKNYWEKVKTFFKNLWEKIKSLFQRIVNKAIDAWNRLTKKYEKLVAGDDVAGAKGYEEISKDSTGVKKLYDFKLQDIDKNVGILTNSDTLVEKFVKEHSKGVTLKDLKVEDVTDEQIKEMLEQKKQAREMKDVFMKMSLGVTADMSSISTREGVLNALKGKQVDSLKALSYAKSYDGLKTVLINYAKEDGKLKSLVKATEKMKRDSAFTAKKLQVLSMTTKHKATKKGIVKYIGTVDSMHREAYNYLLGAILGTIDAKRLVLIQTASIMSACLRKGNAA